MKYTIYTRTGDRFETEHYDCCPNAEDPSPTLDFWATYNGKPAKIVLPWHNVAFIESRPQKKDNDE